MSDLDMTQDTPPEERDIPPVPVVLRVAGKNFETSLLLTDALIDALARTVVRHRRKYTRMEVDKRGHPTTGPHRKLRADGFEVCTICRREQRREAREAKRNKKLQRKMVVQK